MRDTRYDRFSITGDNGGAAAAAVVYIVEVVQFFVRCQPTKTTIYCRLHPTAGDQLFLSAHPVRFCALPNSYVTAIYYTRLSISLYSTSSQYIPSLIVLCPAGQHADRQHSISTTLEYVLYQVQRLGDCPEKFLLRCTERIPAASQHGYTIKYRTKNVHTLHDRIKSCHLVSST